jgi:hypothetical protein
VRPAIGIGNKMTVTNYSWEYTAKSAIPPLTGKRSSPVHGAMNRIQDTSLKGFIRRLTVFTVIRVELFPAREGIASIATEKNMREWMCPIMCLNNSRRIVKYVTIWLPGREPNSPIQFFPFLECTKQQPVPVVIKTIYI